jgi:hypothetical protein
VRRPGRDARREPSHADHGHTKLIGPAGAFQTDDPADALDYYQRVWPEARKATVVRGFNTTGGETNWGYAVPCVAHTLWKPRKRPWTHCSQVQPGHVLPDEHGHAAVLLQGLVLPRTAHHQQVQAGARVRGDNNARGESGGMARAR